ncbi:MAG TPA: AAA family ATPase [Prevotellaceae bacterium]|jgi:predicted AAA+ superfamily ATPase|nr:AAA family ATPase [Prevotellaceae bacterium]
MDNFFHRHAYLIEHTDASVPRVLMNEIDWSHRLIGIKGPRGVGKTSFLLQYIKLHFNPQSERCLYISMSSFYFQGCSLVKFAGEFVKRGGRVLVIDQIYKQEGWRDMICECYHTYPQLNIIYSTTTVEQAEAKDHEINTLSKCYFLHGFSLREYINQQTHENLPRVTLEEVLFNTEQVQKNILMKVRPWIYLQNYLHHGYYPFYQESYNFTERLLKNLNAMIEIDILFIKQIDIKYLTRLKQLLYLLTVNQNNSPNVSYLAKEIQTSRATVMNYMNSLEDARLIHQIYKSGANGPKKPARILLHNTNLLYALLNDTPREQDIMETFFTNSVWRHHTVESGQKPGIFIVNNHKICVCNKTDKRRKDNDLLYARYNCEVSHNGDIPIWLFGFIF